MNLTIEVVDIFLIDDAKRFQGGSKSLDGVALPVLGGAADLVESTTTEFKGGGVFSATHAGRNVAFGIREHAMGSIVNGIALHGGFRPYGGSFLVFTDYCRPSIRLSAMMGLRVVYVMTHDSIGLGEDGPTHQPIEQLAGLRAMPNLCVFRPADAVETLECWQCALEQRERPSVLALSRQNLPALRVEDAAENLCARGAYVLRPADGGEARVRIGKGSGINPQSAKFQAAQKACMKFLPKRPAG